MEQSILVFRQRRIVELPTGKDLHLDEAGRPHPDGLISLTCRDGRYSLGQETLEPFRKCGSNGMEGMLLEEKIRCYSTVNAGMIRIGSMAGSRLTFDDADIEAVIGPSSLDLIRGALYLNGRLLQTGEHPVQPGDCLLIGSTKVIPREGFLLCSGRYYSCSLNAAVEIPTTFEDFPVYKRSPRIIRREPEDTVQILPPPQKEPRKKGQLIKVVLPPLAMLLVTVAVSILMKRGTFVLISAAAMMMSMIFSITSYFSDKREQREKEEERTKNYDAYLLRLRKQLYELQRRQSEALRYHYPTVPDILSMTRAHSNRLYERAANDGDFLCLSLGRSSLSPSYHVKTPGEEVLAGKDPLRSEMEDMVAEFLTLRDMPVVVDLKKAHLGLVGEKQHIHQELRSILAQLCFLQSYHDVEIILMLEEQDAPAFAWSKWYPHCRIKSINMSGLVSGENHRDQVLGNIAQVLKVRKQKKDEEKKDSRYLPHYVFLIDNPRLIINHSIMEYLREESTDLGFSLIYSTAMQANLPENIKTIALLEGGGHGVLFMDEGALVRRTLETPLTDNLPLEEMARRLAPIVHNRGVTTQIPDSITFFELYGVKNPHELPIRHLWESNASYKSLSVPLGVRAKDDPVYLDLHEKAHGPHGLVAGTTGSGKSEILQSYILSLAVNFHPYEVGFLLIDYKGGGMANLFRALPHLLGTITNLDGSESMRALASIKSELARRQRVFNEYGVNNINQYAKLFKAGGTAAPLPHLFIISDEFAELKKEQPDFMTELVSAARIGRSLGVHLILATQKPTGVVDDQIWSNSRFKLALKVQDESDSKEVLKTADAARITQPGRSYLQVGNNEIYELFQSAWSGATHSEAVIERGFDSRVYLMNSLGQGQLLNKDLSSLDSADAVQQTQLDAVVKHIAEVYSAMDTQPVERPWLPPLPPVILSPELTLPLSDLPAQRAFHSRIALGMVDIPERQEQVEYVHDFARDGNLAIFGASGFGKSTFEMTAALAMAANNPVSQLHYYVLDFGNSALIQLKKLPHTADYFTFDDTEKLDKLTRLLTEEIRRRKLLFAQKGVMSFAMLREYTHDPLPAILVFIDHYDAVRELGMDFEDFIIKLTRDGPGVGIYTVVSASRANAMRYSLLNNFKNRIALFMYEPSEIAAVVGRSSYKLPEVKGRALIKLDNVSLMQGYLPASCESAADYVRGIEMLAEAMRLRNTDPVPAGIPMLPDILHFSELVERARPEPKQIAVGLDTEEVEVQYLSFSTPVHLIIGAAQTGKTNLLKLICRQCEAERVFITDSRGCDLQKLAQETGAVYLGDESHVSSFTEEFAAILQRRGELLAERGAFMRARDFFADMPPVLVLVDDADRFIELCKPVAASMDSLLAQAAERGVCVIAATIPSRLRGYDNTTKLLKETQSGVVLGNPMEQTMFSFQTPRGYRQQMDMGFLYNRGSATLIKLPLAP